MSNNPKKSPDTPAQERPDPEVLPKATRRKFTAKDKLAHLDAVASLNGMLVMLRRDRDEARCDEIRGGLAGKAAERVSVWVGWSCKMSGMEIHT